MDIQTALTLYKSVVLPIYDYNDFLYVCLPQKSATLLQRLQNLCLKLILQVDKQTSTSYIHKVMNMDQLHVCRAKHCATEMYKIENSLVPQPIQDLFQKSQHFYQTRSTARRDFVTKRKRLEYGRRCFTVRGPKIWHSIPPLVKQAPDIKTFNNTLKIIPWSADMIPIT